MKSEPETQLTLREIIDTIEKSLRSFGFQYAIRNCQTPKHGEGAYVEENWDAKTLGAFISDDLLALFTQALTTLKPGCVDCGKKRCENCERLWQT